ncbi:MAG: MaoC family dehydratase N-terminal domain-containing protein [Acidimicrobiia bacterium]|jgi:acyl dehydratase|nr:MaoC family dehydratase N-terminal domain-containing protein [Acidimicrobiia bacterium]
MVLDTSVIGKSTGAYKVRVERGPVSFFAAALKDDNPIYRDETAAEAAGFEAIPAPPTFSFAMQHMGRFAEEQPSDPTGGSNPMHAVMGDLYAKGGLVLHGEEEFQYHRPIVVGDVLVGEGKIVDLYEKDSDRATMTFIVMETVWRDEATNEPVVTEKFNLIHRLSK